MDQHFTPEEFAEEFSPRTITGFLIDVYREKAEVVTVPARLEEYYKLLDCECITIPEHRIGRRTRSKAPVFAIVCDDNALDRDPQKISAVNGQYAPMLCGNLFIVRTRTDDNGEEELDSLSEQDVEYLKSYILMQATRNFPKPYPMLHHCEYC